MSKRSSRSESKSPSVPPSEGPFPRFVRRGKVKEVWQTAPDEVEFRFSDDISVFDKKIPSLIPHKGETLARTSAHWFEMCSRLGVKHHFLSLSAPNRMRVRRVEVRPDVRAFGSRPRNAFIPLEFVMRYYVAGSLWDRVKAGKVEPPELGFPTGKTVTYGEKLPEPMFEVTTKLEKVDRVLSPEEALRVGGLSQETFQEIREIILRIDEAIQKEITPRGLVHVDGKKEFAFGPDGEPMVVDTFGTGDEDRFWETVGMADGRFEEFSKEFVRQYYRQTGYHAKLMGAREAHQEEPPIPPLPPQLVEEVSRLYTHIYERLTGAPFRTLKGSPSGSS